MTVYSHRRKSSATKRKTKSSWNLWDLLPSRFPDKADYQGARDFICDVIRAAGYKNATVAGKAWAQYYAANLSDETPWPWLSGNPKIFLDVIARRPSAPHKAVPVRAIHRAIWALSLLAPRAFEQHPICDLPEYQAPRWWVTYYTSRWLAERKMYTLSVYGNIEQCAADARDHLERMGLVTPRKRESIKQGLQGFFSEAAWNLFRERLKTKDATAKGPTPGVIVKIIPDA